MRPDSGLLRRRGIALALTLAFEVLLILLLLFMIPPMAGNNKPGNATVFSVDSEGEEKAEATKAEKSAPKASAKPAAAQPRPSVVPPPEVPPPVPPTPAGPLPFVVMTRQEYSAANAALSAARPSESATAGNNGGGSSRGDTPLAGGNAPGGEPLYAAEWYRRPTNAELNTYLPRGWAREGVGLIACRTVARYHVEDCKIIGESPRGGGYGNAVLQASFQFLVRPPRVGGKEMIGTWVSIRIDYSIIRK